MKTYFVNGYIVLTKYDHGFPYCTVFQITWVRYGKESEILLGEIFLLGGRVSLRKGRVISTI